MKRLSKKMVVIGILVIAVIGTIAYRTIQAGKNAPRYERAQVTRGEIQLTILTTGIVQPENRVQIKPPVSGRIETVIASEGDRVRKGQILAWLSSTERAALLDAARAKGPEEYAHWEDYYRATPITAPLNGEIIARAVKAGQTVTSGETVFVLSDHLIIKADVDETDIGRVRRGMEVTFNLDSYPDQQITGKVKHIAFESRTVNNVTTYLVDITPASVPPFMKSGMTVNVTFMGDITQDLLLVPAEAIRMVQGKPTVLIPAPGKKKRAAPISQSIRTGLTDGKFTEVREGLNENQMVLIPSLGRSSSSGKVNPFAPSRRRR